MSSLHEQYHGFIGLHASHNNYCRWCPGCFVSFWTQIDYRSKGIGLSLAAYQDKNESFLHREKWCKMALPLVKDEGNLFKKIVTELDITKKVLKSCVLQFVLSYHSLLLDFMSVTLVFTSAKYTFVFLMVFVWRPCKISYHKFLQIRLWICSFYQQGDL